jgi:hypothetical protein
LVNFTKQDVHISRMNSLSRTKLTLLITAFCYWTSASADGPTQPATNTSPSVVDKVEKAIEHGAKAAAHGIKKGVTAGEHGVERGARAADKGIKRGVNAAAKGVERGATATAHAAKTVAGKVDTSSTATSSTASH